METGQPQSEQKNKKPMVIVLVLLALLIIAGVAYYVMQGWSGGDPQMAADGTAMEDADNGTDGGSLMDKIVGALDQDSNYRATMTMEGGAVAQNSTAVMEFDAPSTMRFVITSAQGATEMITTKDASYMRMNNGPWLKTGTGSDEALASEAYRYDGETLKGWFADTQNADYKGVQPCDGGMCHVYAFTDGDMKTTAYFTLATYRVQKVVAEGPNGQKTTIAYDYDADVSIDVPQNVQTLPTPSAEGTFSPKDLEELQKAYGNL